MRPRDEPSVIAAGAELIARLTRLGERLTAKTNPLAGAETVFVGQIHSGEIYNQYPQECLVEGTRRWLPTTRRADVESELRDLFAEVARDTGTTVTPELVLMRDAFQLDEGDPFVAAFRGEYADSGSGELPVGTKPFCDDGNSFWALARVRPSRTVRRPVERIRWRSGCRSMTSCGWRRCTHLRLAYCPGR